MEVDYRHNPESGDYFGMLSFGHCNNHKVNSIDWLLLCLAKLGRERERERERGGGLPGGSVIQKRNE